MKRYEGMFLFDNTTVHEWSAMEAEVKRLLDRIEAELLVCVKFDERKLAYEINRRKRGTYILTYFDADQQRITELERDARLSESVLRLLVLRPEGLTDERLAELKAHPVEQSLQPHTEGRRGEGSFGRDRYDRRGGRDGGRDARRDGPAKPAGDKPSEKPAEKPEVASATAVSEAPAPAPAPATSDAATPAPAGGASAEGAASDA